MKHYCLVFLLVLMSGCSNKPYQRFDYNISKNPWIDAFKDQVFFSSLKESYKSDSIFKLIEKKDAFNPYDGLSPDAFNKARALGIQLVKNMPPPSMCEYCKGDMNYYMAIALHYYKSEELNRLARTEFKKHLKEDKEVWGKMK